MVAYIVVCVSRWHAEDYLLDTFASTLLEIQCHVFADDDDYDCHFVPLMMMMMMVRGDGGGCDDGGGGGDMMLVVVVVMMWWMCWWRRHR